MPVNPGILRALLDACVIEIQQVGSGAFGIAEKGGVPGEGLHEAEQPQGRVRPLTDDDASARAVAEDQSRAADSTAGNGDEAYGDRGRMVVSPPLETRWNAVDAGRSS